MAGVADLVKRYGSRVVGAAADAHRLPKLDQAVKPGESFDLFGVPVDVLASDGHTRGHIAFHLPDCAILLCGDTLFSLGCGRLLEGTAEEMFDSLQALAALPPETLVCCGHEYSESNARFALTRRTRQRRPARPRRRDRAPARRGQAPNPPEGSRGRPGWDLGSPRIDDHLAVLHDPLHPACHGGDVLRRIPRRRPPRSARNPGATRPMLDDCRTSAAPVRVAAARASAGVIPAFTNHSSSRAFWPNMVKTASEPMAIGTLAWMARRRVSRLRAMKGANRATASGE